MYDYILVNNSIYVKKQVCVSSASGRGVERGERSSEFAGEKAGHVHERRRRARGEDPDQTRRRSESAEEEGEVRASHVYILSRETVKGITSDSSHLPAESLRRRWTRYRQILISWRQRRRS